MFRRLVTYKEKLKSTNVPKAYAADPEVDKYATHTLQKNKQIHVERIHCLESIGFVCNCQDSNWMEMYDRLDILAYKKHHKSTQVPWQYTKDPPQLGCLTGKQRLQE